MLTAVWALIEESVRQRADEVLLEDDHGRSLTARQLRDEGERVAAGLMARGLGPRDVLSWQLPTVLEAPVLMAACARLGVVQNPIIPVLREREVALITKQLDTRLLVVPETWRGFSHGDMARALDTEVLAIDFESPPGPEMRLPIGDPSTLPSPPEQNHA